MTGGSRDVRDTVQHFLEQVEQLRHLWTAAGNILLHLVDERLNAGGHRHVHRRTVGILADNAEAVVHAQPFHLDAVLIHDRPNITGIFHGSKIAELMQRRLDLKPAAPERRCAAAGKVVLLDEQCLFACQCGLERRG